MWRESGSLSLTACHSAPSEQFTLTGYVQGFSPFAINANNGPAVQLDLAPPVPVRRAGLSTLRRSWANVGLAFPLTTLNTMDAPQDWQLDASISLQW